MVLAVYNQSCQGKGVWERFSYPLLSAQASYIYSSRPLPDGGMGSKSLPHPFPSSCPNAEK